MASTKFREKQFIDHVNFLQNNSKNKCNINEQIIKGIQKKTKKGKLKKFDFMKEIIDITERKYQRTSPNIKYSHEIILSSLVHFTITQVSWRRFQGIIPGKYLNAIHLRYIENGVYDAINKRLLEIYLETNRCMKLKYQSIDSSFIANKRGLCNVKHPTIVNNRYNGRKKYLKISHIVDVNGVVLGSHIIPGNVSDFKSVDGTIDNIKINVNTKKYENNNKYKQYLLADSGYDSKEIHSMLSDKGYTPIIKPNNRRTKRKSKIRKLSTKHKKIYKKRQIVEASFAWVKSYPVINQNYQKTITSYNGLLLLANTIILSNKISKERN